MMNDTIDGLARISHTLKKTNYEYPKCNDYLAAMVDFYSLTTGDYEVDNPVVLKLVEYVFREYENRSSNSDTFLFFIDFKRIVDRFEANPIETFRNTLEQQWH